MRLLITLGAVAWLGVFGGGRQARAVEYSDAISRQVLVVNSTPVEYTDAITRQVLVLNAVPVEYTDAITRQVLVFLPPYTPDEIQTALRVAAGLLLASQDKLDRLNIVRDGASATTVDLRDAVKIARMAIGLDP